ncbi:hypothetical protein PMS59_09510, partial [Bifidobacterium longum]|nr:hypothetical protein [Bifidobacterium longum]
FVSVASGHLTLLAVGQVLQRSLEPAWIGVGGANMFAEGCVDGDVLATVNISAAGEDKLFSGEHQHNKGVTHARFHFP